jgi:hypothetical protein
MVSRELEGPQVPHRLGLIPVMISLHVTAAAPSGVWTPYCQSPPSNVEPGLSLINIRYHSKKKEKRNPPRKPWPPQGPHRPCLSPTNPPKSRPSQEVGAPRNTAASKIKITPPPANQPSPPPRIPAQVHPGYNPRIARVSSR